MREQRGYVFHKGKSWFLRYCDDVMQPDGTIRRKQVCKKLKVEYGGDYRTQKSAQPFVAEILTPLNGGLLNPQSTMLVTEFVERIYLSEYVDKNLRAATKKQYRDIWENHLKPRMGKLTLRGFRTVHGEQMLRRSRRKRSWDAVPFAIAKPFFRARLNRRSAWASSTV